MPTFIQANNAIFQVSKSVEKILDIGDFSFSNVRQELVFEDMILYTFRHHCSRDKKQNKNYSQGKNRRLLL